MDIISRKLACMTCLASSFSSFLLSPSFCSPSPLSTTYSALSSLFSVFLPFHIWHVTFPSISPCIMSHCVSAPIIIRCPDSVLMPTIMSDIPVTIITVRNSKSSGGLRPHHRSVCDVCYHRVRVESLREREPEMASYLSAVLFTWLLNHHTVFIWTTAGKM